MLKAGQPDQGLAYTRKNNSTNESPRYGSWEGEVVIYGGEAIGYVVGRCAVDEDVMCCLEIERFLDFSVWREKEVDEGSDEEK